MVIVNVDKIEYVWTKHAYTHIRQDAFASLPTPALVNMSDHDYCRASLYLQQQRKHSVPILKRENILDV